MDAAAGIEHDENYKNEIKRPTSISLTNDSRNWENYFLYRWYKVLRVFHVSIWFYPFPFIVLIVMYMKPFEASFE